jgi:hypothetical protein
MNRFLTAIIFAMIVFLLTAFNAAAQNFRCGDKIRITHLATGANLHSQPINYAHSGTSGQQQITSFLGADNNDIWVTQDCSNAQLRDGNQFRLQHLATGKFLHSHPGFPAPVTQSQQEITGWVGKDNNDLWRVEVDGGGNWSVNKKIRLIHVATNVALHSHNVIGGLLADRQQEVTGYSGRDYNDFWSAEYDKTSGVNPSNGNNNNNFNNFGEGTFAGVIQRTDVLSKAIFSNNGKIEYVISMKNRDRFIGSCLAYYLILADASGNIFKTFSGDPLCVDGRQPNNARGERVDKLKYSISKDEYYRMSRAAVLFTPGGKIALELFRGNLDTTLNEMTQLCPECVKNIVSVGGSGQRF